MASKKLTFDPTAIFAQVQDQIVHDTEYTEQQQIVPNADLSHAEYDPMIDDGNMPYMPSNSGPVYQQPQQQQQQQMKPMQGFIDIDNMQNMSNPQMQGQPQQYQQQMYEGAQEPGIDYGQASKNIGDMTNVMDSFNTVDQSTSTHDDTESYAISVAIKTLNDVIRVLKDVEYWIPKQHAQDTATLNKVGRPIVNALSAYVAKIEKMK